MYNKRVKGVGDLLISGVQQVIKYLFSMNLIKVIRDLRDMSWFCLLAGQILSFVCSSENISLTPDKPDKNYKKLCISTFFLKKTKLYNYELTAKTNWFKSLLRKNKRRKE